MVDAHGVHGVDPQNKVHDLIAAAHEDTEIFPLLKNYNVLTQEWDQSVAAMLKNPAARDNLERQLGNVSCRQPELPRPQPRPGGSSRRCAYPAITP